MKTPGRPSPVLFLFFMIFLTSAFGQDWPGIRDSIYSEVLKENRRIQIILPDDYKSSGKTYEVLYVLDGEWYMQQIPFIYNFAANSGYAPRNIFVLIPNTYRNGQNLRDRDFSPTKPDNSPILGGADNFHEFIKSELIPYVEKKFRTSGSRSLVGSSFSGLFCVYAFLKDPGLFRSYVASDPNLNWDQNFPSKLAAGRLKEFSGENCTLYIAGLTTTFDGMGISAMRDVLTANAPPSIHWKCVAYEDETHYSVQHKAFYDGFRFSHFGFSAESPEFHPMNGILQEGKSLKLLVTRGNVALRYTEDGSEPNASSPRMSQAVSVSGPATFKAKAVSNRAEYVHEVTGDFRAGSPLNSNTPKSAKAGLKYFQYLGSWNDLPGVVKSRPVISGVVDQGFNINLLAKEKTSFWRIEGNMDIPEDGYYVFYADSPLGARVTAGDQLLFEISGTKRLGQSFVVPLKKGLCPLRLELLQKKDSAPITFFIRRTTAGNDQWWDTPFFQL